MNKTSLLRIYAVARREFTASLASPAAWVFLVLFLAMSGLCTFVFSDILAAGQADLSGFFNWMPWLFLFLVPALGMPLWSEERRTGTFELSLSYPVTLWELIAGKYLAGMALLLMALLLTASIPGTIYFLGKPDTGAILCGYFGALMIGSAFLSVASFCSALTRSQTASFLLALMFCAFLVFTGWDRISGLMADYMPAWFCSFTGYLTIIPHYQAFQRGLLDTSELVYCGAVTALFLFCTKLALEYSSGAATGIFTPGAFADRRVGRNFLRLAGGLLIAFYCFSCIVYAASVFRARFDCTADRAYSLSDVTRDFAANLNRPAELRLYVSPESANMPGVHRQYAERVSWLLRELASASKGNIVFTEIRPEPDSREEESALLDGIQPVQNPTGDRFFLGLSVSSMQNNAPIPFLFPAKENLLEYEIVRSLRNVTAHGRKKTVGLMSEFPLLGRIPDPQRGVSAFAAWQIFREIAGDYDFCEIPMDIAAIPNEIDAVIVVHPVSIGKRGEYALDQYLLRGGKLLVFLDPRSAFAEANARRDYSMMEKVRSNLPDLLRAWGIAWDPESMAADLKFKYDRLSSTGVRQTVPSALRITAEGISRTNPLTSALTSLWMNYAGILKLADEKPLLRYEKLITTSDHAKSVSVQAMQEKVFAEFAKEAVKPLPLGWRISGRFPTAFPDGAPDTVSGEHNPKKLKESARDSEVYLFADSDMLFHDACVTQTQDEFGQKLTLYINDNMVLFQNIVEEMTGKSSLASLRSRVPMNRPMLAIQESREKAELAFRDRIMVLMRDFTAETRKVEALRRVMVANPGQIRLSPEQQELLQDFARKESEFKREVKEYRNQLKAELDAVSRSARIWNILCIPGAAALAGLVWSLMRRFKWRRRS